MIAYAGTSPLTRMIARRDRVRIAVWVLAIVLMVVVSAASTIGLYPTQADLDKAAEASRDNPAALAFNGPDVALDTIGGQVAFQVGAIGLTFVGLMSLLMMSRLTRGEEDSGRLELVRAMPVGRHAPIAAAVWVVGAMNVAVGALVAISLITLELPTMGSLILGASFTALGLFFIGVTLVAAQVTENPRVVSGISGAVLGLSFLVRAIGDVGDGTLSWFSPIGLAQKSRPYGGDVWWPLLLCVAFATGLAAIGASLASRRDFGAGLIAPRAAPASGAPTLGSPHGLAVRLQRGVVWWWAVGVFLAGVAYGSIADSIEDFIADSEALEDIVARVGAATVVDAYLATTLLILALIGAGCGLQAVQRLRSEESERRAEPVLSTRTSRWRWAGSHLAVAYGGTALVLAAGGFGAGLIYGLIIGDLGQVGRLLAAALAYTPAAWVMIAIGVALFGLAPRWTMLAWAPLSACFVIGLLGDLLGLPQWLEDLSPFERTPSVPAVDLALGPLVVMTIIGVGVTWLGLVGLQRRDIG